MRPSLYTEEILARSREYLENFEDHGDAIPSIAGLAILLKVSRQSLYNWAEKHEDFLDILESIKAKQEQTLINKGLTGEFNAAITKLALGKHGYSDKQETEVNATFNISDEPSEQEWEEEHS